MRVRTPILSVRKLVRDDHEIYINGGGVSIRDTTSGKQIKLFEQHAGAYYLKLKITPPVDSSGNNNGFGGHGA